MKKPKLPLSFNYGFFTDADSHATTEPERQWICHAANSYDRLKAERDALAEKIEIWGDAAERCKGLKAERDEAVGILKQYVCGSHLGLDWRDMELATDAATSLITAVREGE